MYSSQVCPSPFYQFQQGVEKLNHFSGLPLHLFAGGGDGELRAALPLLLLAGGGGVQGVGVRIWSSLCDCEVDELIYKNDFVVPDGKVSDAKFMKQSSGGRETETSKTLDITGLGTLLGAITVEEANTLSV